MSMRDEINACCNEGRLIRHVPINLRGAAERRAVYYSRCGLETRSINEALQGNVIDDKDLERWVYVRQYLDAFIEVEGIPVAPNSRRAGRAYMSLLEPPSDEVWDIRCYDPKKGLRVLGRFAEKDVFIALAWDYRENLLSDIEWGAAKRRCLQAWQLFFGLRDALRGRYPDDYVTGSYFSTDHIW